MMYSWAVQPGVDRKEQGLHRGHMLPYVREQLVEAICVQGIHHHRGYVHTLPTRNIVAQSHIGGVTQLLLNLRGEKKKELPWMTTKTLGDGGKVR